jgi:hypothetical protein
MEARLEAIEAVNQRRDRDFSNLMLQVRGLTRQYNALTDWRGRLVVFGFAFCIFVQQHRGGK